LTGAGVLGARDLHAFPIQQWLIGAVSIARTPAGLFVLSFPLTVAVAAVSWHLLEAAALRLKARIAPARPLPSGG
jgi:peptidoglycan/LPS O-acetylase OafA/YrhL